VDYEAEYNNRARVPEHPAIIEGWARDAASYRASGRAEFGLAYGPRERERLDLFFSEREDDRTLIGLFIHGGYWQGLDRSLFSHMARGLNLHGFTVAVPSYELCPQVSLAVIVDEMREAARFLWRSFKRPILAFGHSAGGHLTAALVATRFEGDVPTRLVPAGLPISGLFELEPLIPTSINGALRLDAVEAHRLSPLFWNPPAGARLLAAVGGEESGEFLRQSRAIVEAWGKAGVEAVYYEAPGDNHFTVIKGLAEADSALTGYLVALATGPSARGLGRRDA
jgi:arylformamidase